MESNQQGKREGVSRLNCRKTRWRADLLELLKLGMSDATAASLLGYQPPNAESEPPVTAARDSSALDLSPVQGTAIKKIEATLPPLWRIIGPTVRPLDPKSRQIPELLSGPAYSEQDLGGRAGKPVAHVPLLPRARLGLVLRSLLLIDEPGRRVDEPKLVGLLARCQHPTRVPRRNRRVWPVRLQIYWDQSQVLWPFRQDQFEVIEWVRRWRGAQGLEEIVIDHLGKAEWYPQQVDALPRAPRQADCTTTIVALSDLGCAKSGDARRGIWRNLVQRANLVGARCHALVLSSPDRWDPSLVRAWGGIAWDRARTSARGLGIVPGISEEARNASVNRLFALLSPTVRVEWALLAAVRRSLLPGPSDVLTESDAWTDPRAAGRCTLGFAIRYEDRADLLKDFAVLPESQRTNLKAELKAHHEALSPVVLAEELMMLGDKQSKDEGTERFAKHLRLLAERGAPTDAELAHADRLVARQGPEDWNEEVKAVFWALHHARGSQFDEPLPEGLKIEKVVWALNRIPAQSRCSLWQRGQYLYLLPANDRDVPGLDCAGVHLADIPMAVRQLEVEWRSGSRRLRIERFNIYGSEVRPFFREEPRANCLTVSSDLATISIVLESRPEWSEMIRHDQRGLWIATATQSLTYPPWATHLNNDEYGLFADLELAKNVFTRMRWIPPGRFLMGSPENETGRWKYEGPRHRVTLTQGFWLADAPCTQAEWREIMGANPSHFTDNKCPVEQVSWDDCQEFCRKLKERMPWLDARLPTEAEWEYACRAGTLGAYNDGSDCTEPEGKDPALEKLGWYSENSDNRTHPVRNQKFKPNAWGLFDMHGNVLEWCMDYWQDNYASAEQHDPQGPADGSFRVFRGGGWSVHARFCRSAYRYGGHSAGRFNDLGFRLAAGQVSQEIRPEREQDNESEASGRRRSDEGRGAGAADGVRSQAKSKAAEPGTASNEPRPRTPGRKVKK